MPRFPNYDAQKQQSLRERSLNLEFPAHIFLLKVNSRNSRTRCKICSNLRVMSPERRQSYC